MQPPRRQAVPSTRHDSLPLIGGFDVTVELTGSPGSRERDRAVRRWVVCLMATRDVVDGVVSCPLVGLAPLSRCRECHLLQALESDWRSVDCATPDP